MNGFVVKDTFGERYFDDSHRSRTASDGSLVITYSYGDLVAIFSPPYRIEYA